MEKILSQGRHPFPIATAGVGGGLPAAGGEHFPPTALSAAADTLVRLLRSVSATGAVSRIAAWRGGGGAGQRGARPSGGAEDTPGDGNGGGMADRSACCAAVHALWKRCFLDTACDLHTSVSWGLQPMLVLATALTNHAAATAKRPVWRVCCPQGRQSAARGAKPAGALGIGGSSHARQGTKQQRQPLHCRCSHRAGGAGGSSRRQQRTGWRWHFSCCWHRYPCGN